MSEMFSQPVEGAVQKDDLWYVEKAFNPTQFDQKIGDYNYTVNDYIKNALSGSYPAKLKNLCASLYVYSYNANLLLNS